MATKLRLQRHGRNKQAYYYIVAADSRAPRDGRFIERIGDYNPNTNPATINLDLKQAVKWLDTGAIPTDTVRAILSYKGAMMLHHLHSGANKGAFTAEEADKRFEAWMTEKESKVQSKRDKLADTKAQSNAEKLKAEGKIKEAKAAAIAAKKSAAEAAAAAAANPVAEETVAETPVVEENTSADEVNTTEVNAETTETPAADNETTAENTEA
jgi:small subunit ribosomal protein S16